MKYQKVYMDIKEKIQKGIYKPWTSLEGEELLCKKYGTSRTTIRKAISKLKQDGFLHTRQGSGIYINPPEFYEEYNLSTLSEKIEDNSKLENLLLEFKIIHADDNLSKLFNIAIGNNIFYYKRLRIINSSPKVLEETYMPQYLFPDFNEEKVKSSVIKYIEEDCNYIISHDIKNISAVIMDEELSRLLKMEKGSATLQIIHKVYLIKSILAQYTKEIQVKNSLSIISVR